MAASALAEPPAAGAGAAGCGAGPGAGAVATGAEADTAEDAPATSAELAPASRCFRYSSKDGAAEMDLRGSSCSKASGLRVSAIPPAPTSALYSCIEARWPDSCGLKAPTPVVPERSRMAAVAVGSLIVSLANLQRTHTKNEAMRRCGDGGDAMA